MTTGRINQVAIFRLFRYLSAKSDSKGRIA